jgi:GDP-4-dehydro-6-deoxy-D-mannose reductase
LSAAAVHDRPVALITGAAGFAGRHLISELETQTDWSIIGVARHAVPEPRPRTRMLAADLRDRGLVERIIERWRPDYVFHLAAQSYVPKSLATPADTLSNNIVGQVNLLEALRTRGQPTILVVGSAEQYGFATPQEMPLTEDQPFRPGNPYAVSKITQDMLGYQYFRSYGMRIVRVRPFNHFGPGQSDRFVMATFSRQVAEAERGLIEPTVLTGDLSSRRDFLDVRDVVRAYRMAVERGTAGEVYNIASGNGYRIGELLERLLELATSPLTVAIDPARLRPSDIPVLIGDASRFKAATGWDARIPIKQTLSDTLNDWRRRVAADQR